MRGPPGRPGPCPPKSWAHPRGSWCARASGKAGQRPPWPRRIASPSMSTPRPTGTRGSRASASRAIPTRFARPSSPRSWRSRRRQGMARGARRPLRSHKGGVRMGPGKRRRIMGGSAAEGEEADPVPQPAEPSADPQCGGGGREAQRVSLHVTTGPRPPPRPGGTFLPAGGTRPRRARYPAAPTPKTTSKTAIVTLWRAFPGN